MAEAPFRSENQSDATPANGRLDSWKEIAAYLKRDSTTVRRWEKREGLPVHRHLHDRRDSVYAYTGELDDWLKGRRNRLSEAGVAGERHEPGVWVRRALAAIVVVAALVGSFVLGVFYARPAPAAAPVIRFSISPPEQTQFGAVSLSPDGRRLAFTASTREGQSFLWIQPLDSLSAHSLPETEDATFPFWAPDSNALGFFAGGKLWISDISGGRPRLVTDAPHGRGGTWNRNGMIVFAPGREGALHRVPASGGAAIPVTKLEPSGELGHVWPEFLPDGNHFLYLAYGSTRQHDNLFVGALDSKERKRLLTVSSNAVYGRDGHLLFARGRRLMAVPFDAARLTVTGEPVTFAETVLQEPGLDRQTDFSVSTTGVLVYRRGQGPKTQLVWRDRAGQQSRLTTTPAEYYEPTLSPDEQRVAIDVFDSRPSQRFGFGAFGVTSDIWILDRTTATAASRLTSDPGAEFDPIWSPDGDRIAFSSNRGGTLDLYQKNASGAGNDELLLASELAKAAQDWSPDGRFLVYGTFEPSTRGDLWLLPMAGDRRPEPLLRTEANEEQAQISPDGRWFAYTAQASGRSEVYVRSFPSPGSPWQISTNGGGHPRWRSDGSELFYVSEDRRLMAVAVKTGATFEHGAAVPLFDTGIPPHFFSARNLYDVSRDGRFLFMTAVDDDDPSLPFTVVVNWAAGLRKQHAPSARVLGSRVPGF